MTPWINYHHLYYFKTIAEEGSVSKAATKLRLGQPTLSAQLKQFEQTLGVTLFDRHHKRLELTDQGRIALDYARNIFAIGSEMYEVLHDRILPQRISLHVGALDSIAKQTILQLVQKAFKHTPCQITLSEGKSDELLAELHGHRLDLLVTNFLPTGSEAKGLIHRLIVRKPVSVFAAPKFKHLRQGFPQSLSGQPFIVPTFDSRLRYALDHWGHQTGISVDIIVESQDIAIKKLMAISGMGLMPTASHTVTSQILSGELVELGKLAGVHEELYLVMGRRKISNPVAAHLFEAFSL